MTNSEDPDQLASLEANWSGSTLFAKAEDMRVQPLNYPLICPAMETFAQFLRTMKITGPGQNNIWHKA